MQPIPNLTVKYSESIALMPTESVEPLFEDEHVYNQGLEFFRPRSLER
ncbi:hypothetical protein NLL30_02150 [Corynebacterium propinquum]|nr:hypothetical protein [Corynebacterium propinquum]WKS36761.1 hypothetical protein NLL30_02150 [Corynebacterium propinquum]